MITTVEIPVKKPLSNSTIKLLLEHYNVGKIEKVYIEEVPKSTCFSDYTLYKFYKEVGDMPNHYIEGNLLTQAETISFLSTE